MKLLNHYFVVPNRIQLIDNSDETVVVAEKNENVVQIYTSVPEWITHYLSSHFNDRKEPDEKLKNLSIEDIRRKYHETLKGKT